MYGQHMGGHYFECSNPCRVMTVTTINKFKAIRKGTMEIKILLPRIVNVTKDVFVKTFISLVYRNIRNVLSSLNSSCGNWWLPGNDSWRKHDGSTVDLKKSSPANLGQNKVMF